MIISYQFSFCFLILHLVTVVLVIKLPSEEELDTNANPALEFGHISQEFTDKIGHEIFPATRELLHHLKERKVSLMVEPSGMYMDAASKIVSEYNTDVVSVDHLAYTKSNYSFESDFPSILRATFKASREAKVIILLMDLRLVKECLVAAYDLQLNSGDIVFLAYEVDLSYKVAYQRRPFKWSTMDFLTSTKDSYENFLFRSKKLCWMWEHTFVVMVTLPKQVSGQLNTSHGNTFVDIKEGDGNMRFSTVEDHHVFIGKNGDVQYPLSVYRYGRKGANAARQCVSSLTAAKVARSSPKMYSVANFHLIKNDQCASCTGKWTLSLVVNRNWPSHHVACSRVHSGKCVLKGKISFHFIEAVFAITGAVLLILVFIVMHQEYTKTCKEDYVGNGPKPIMEYKHPVDV